MTTATITDADVSAVFVLFEKWIKQRAGLDSAAPTRQEARSIQQDGRRAKLALAEARAYPPNAAAMLDAFSAFSGRLQLERGKDGALQLDYCTGQYWPTEYRKAAASVLERYIETVRPKVMPGGRIPTSMDELKAANYAAGGKWFDRSNMKFFRTRVVSQIISGPGGVFFVTSEQREDHTARLFTVRRFDPQDGDVDTFGEFHAWETKAQAMREARRAAFSPEPLCRICAGSGKDKHDEAKPCWRCNGTGKQPKEDAA